MQKFNTDVAVLGALDAERLGDMLKNEIDTMIADRLETAVRSLTARIDADRAEMKAELAALTHRYNNAIARYNEAVEAVNTMQIRLAALEANYDPTIIK